MKLQDYPTKSKICFFSAGLLIGVSIFSLVKPSSERMAVLFSSSLASSAFVTWLGMELKKRDDEISYKK